MEAADPTRDTVEIIQTINRYAHALDGQRWEELAGVFAEDAVADYSSAARLAGGEAVRSAAAMVLEGRDDIVGWLSTALADRPGTLHFMTTHQVDVDRDRASSRHYMHNRNSSLVGVYTCDHVRTADGWRIASLRLDERVLDQHGLEEGRDRPGAGPPPGVVDRIVDVADRLELHELGPRYAHLIDERRWDDLDAVFVADATADYTSIGGDDARLEGLPAIRSWLVRQLDHRTEAVPWHYVTDTVVTLHGDGTASCRSSMHNRYLQVIGVYESEAVRTEHGWRFAHLRLAARMMPGTPVS